MDESIVKSFCSFKFLRQDGRATGGALRQEIDV
jgi:hypothetical protein